MRDLLHGAANGDSVCLCGEACTSVRCRASASEVSRRCCYYYCRRLLVPVSVFAVVVVVVVVVVLSSFTLMLGLWVQKDLKLCHLKLRELGRRCVQEGELGFVEMKVVEWGYKKLWWNERTL